ncbi:membrane dipeptidase [bacterium]|nr:membrane dipeptidase [bacterium]
MSWLFDGHLDLAWNAIDWKRDLRQSVANIRQAERGRTEPGYGTNTVSLPALREGRVGICIATILARLHRPGNPMFGYATPEAVYAVGQGQIAYYRALARAGDIRLLQWREDLDEHLHQWNRSPATTPIGVILSMEGADPVLDPSNIDEWYHAGLRAIGLTHYGLNRYGGGTAVKDGLAPMASELLARIEKLGIALDMTHLSDQAFDEVRTLFQGRILASHQNVRRLVPDQRQFTDEQLCLVIERGGVIGAAFDVWMLQANYVRGESKPNVTLNTVADHIAYVCDLAGNAHHSGIGTDLDGGFGTEQTPTDIDTIADVIRLTDVLSSRGFADKDIDLIMHGNWCRFWREILPPRPART